MSIEAFEIEINGSAQDLDSPDLEKYYDSAQLPCQIEDRKEREKTIESQLEYSADKMFHSQKSQVDEKKFDEGFFKRELRDMQERCLENQRTMQRIENKYFRSKSQSQDCSNISSQFQQEEKQNHDSFLPHDSKYNLECEVSVIKKNLSINQDLSLLERACDEDKNSDLEIKVHVLMSENLKLSKINQSLFQEVEHYKEGLNRNSSRQRSESREIMLRNTQISELQRRVFDAERGQVEKQSEDYALSQCLERKVQQIGEQNSILVRQVERYKQELHQSQQQIHEISEINAHLEEQLQNQTKNQGWIDNDRDEYQRLKIEFEEFQSLTQNIINQEEECQRRICEQDEELAQQAVIQEDLVNRIGESDVIYQAKIYEMKQSFQNEFEAAIRRMQEQNQNLREQNQYLFDQLQSYELEKQNIEEYFLNEIESIKEQCQIKCDNNEQQVRAMHEKQLQDKNQLIAQLQEQSTYQYDNEQVRSKSLSACNGINKLAGMLSSSKTNQNYYLPPYRANISLEEDQYNRIKQNNSYHNSNTNAAALNTSLTYKKKAQQQQIYKQQSKQNEKENTSQWEKSALLLSQQKQKDLYYREQQYKQKNNLQLRQLDGDFKYSPQIQGPESRVHQINSHQNSTTNNTAVLQNYNTNNRYANIYNKQTFQNDSRISLSNGPIKNLKK